MYISTGVNCPCVWEAQWTSRTSLDSSDVYSHDREESLMHGVYLFAEEMAACIDDPRDKAQLVFISISKRFVDV